MVRFQRQWMLRKPLHCSRTVVVVARLVAVLYIGCCCPEPSNAFSASSNSKNPTVVAGTSKNVATQTLQGVGLVPAARLDEYNVFQYSKANDEEEQNALARCCREWTATLVQKAAEQETILQLGCRSQRDLFVDTVTVQFPRWANNSGSSLGVELQELAGGRDDGLGITVVTGLVPGGAAENAGILPGDSFAQVSVIRTENRGGSLEESKQVTSVQTECQGYDATVDALSTLPPPLLFSEKNDDNENLCDDVWSVTLKRLRRKPVVTVKLQYPPDQDEDDVTLELFAGENLRQGMLVRGVQLNDPLAKRFDTKNSGNCGAGGLCRTCSVVVLRGADLLNEQRPAEQTMLRDKFPRWRLACKAIVGYGMQEGELSIRVNPNQW